jgi:uncharacterized protein (TIGR02145 family)
MEPDKKLRAAGISVLLTALIILISASACVRNHAPVINQITCSPETRSAGTWFTFRAVAIDEDDNPLQFRWSSDGGYFRDSANQSQVDWRSPVDGNGKTFTIRLTVSDGEMESFHDFPVSLSEPVFGEISGYAYFANCTVPVPGARVSIDEKSTLADDEGFFSIREIPVGTYSVSATHEGFEQAVVRAKVLHLVNTKVKIPMLSSLYTSKVYGMVRGQDSLPIGGVRVAILNPDQTESDLTTTTNAAGYYKIWFVPSGLRTLIARKPQTEEFGFGEVVMNLAITGAEFPLDLEMQKYELIGIFTDGRDRHVYGYKIYGTQTWMTENLAFLPAVSPPDVGIETGPCYYVYGYAGRDVAEARSGNNFAAYGVLYNWNAALDCCPKGWHLPSDTEWKVFENYLGADAGFRMKSTFGWTNHGNGNNTSGFNVLPAGIRQESTGFTGMGNMTQLWSASVLIGHGAWTRVMAYDDNLVSRFSGNLKFGYSVRCIKD